MNELPDLPTTRRAVGFRNEGMFFKAEVLFQRRLGDGAFKSKETMQLLRPFRDGSPAPDKTLMVHIERGIGDAILYSC